MSKETYADWNSKQWSNPDIYIRDIPKDKEKIWPSASGEINLEEKINLDAALCVIILNSSCQLFMLHMFYHPSHRKMLIKEQLQWNKSCDAETWTLQANNRYVVIGN